MAAGKPNNRRGKEASDEKLLIALACGATAAKAAHDADVSVRTVERRLAEPDFQARLRHLRGDMLERAGGALVAAAMKSVQTLLMLQDVSQPPATRLGAAKAILELGLKIREVAELEVRLRELEERVSGTTPTNPSRGKRGGKKS